MFRGAGPLGIEEGKWQSLDGHLLSLAVDKGASVIHGRAAELSRTNGRPQIKTRDGSTETYDLLAIAIGVNTASLKVSHEAVSGYQAPRTAKTYVREYHLGQEMISTHLGSSVHVFLLNIPGLEFAAVIPKGDYVTMCLVGEGIDKELVQSFLERPEVQQRFPPDVRLDQPSCRCSPRINVQGAAQPFADGVVFIGDCGVTRFYKDGIGSAYRAAKAAATTAVFQGISAADFREHYWPVCQALNTDNGIAKFIFAVVRQIQRRDFTRRAVVRMVSREQRQNGGQRRMSTMMWDMYTGGAPYREILLRALHPGLWVPLLGDCAVSLINRQ
jgi:flavin-dependent dehydrogenase